ncbi:MAG: NUDIX domain-containing protein [bacterium]|nr:NUDIX domain-containing protein [bacterium]MDZ4285073.1 NUDIX domain-containing protein [Patescibacteria group bacterium]
MKTHTLGFIFSPSFEEVLLIEKQRPDWQRGKLNGIGGKIESGEGSVQCMVREASEECGLYSERESWMYIGIMEGSEWSVDVYALIHQGALDDIQTTTDEEVAWYPVAALPHHALSNVPWLIHLAIDKLRHDKFHSCTVQYR